MPHLISVDLFAGAGGLSLGFHMGGFTPALANDFDANAARTFRQNFPDTHFDEGPIQELNAGAILETLGFERGKLDVLLGGPPCQAFSFYNHQRGFHDERSGLFREYLRIVKDLMPKTLVIENVVGMASLDGGRAVEEIYSQLGKLGYSVEHRVLEAERYGVPQERRRIFILASRVGPIHWPKPTHGPLGDLFDGGKTPFVTVDNALSDLPALQLGEGTDSVVRYQCGPNCHFQHMMRSGSPGVRNHIAPLLGDINRKRMKHIPQGGSWRDIPFDLLPAGMKRAKRSDHTKRYGRLHPDKMASTILTKCDLHWGAYIHPEQDRTLTVREAARFQTFPDQFEFIGSRVEQYRQVGNAVPPILAAAVAKSVKAMLDATSTRQRHCLVSEPQQGYAFAV